MEDEQIITQEGYDKLQKELDELVKIKRTEIAHRIESAKELGDLSENAEYHDAKDAQAFNEGRIMEINSLLKNIRVVSNGDSQGTVGMGSTLTVRSKNNQKEFTIVSFNESDPINGKISNESPLGKAFLGKKKKDKVIVSTPSGDVEYEIISIK